MSNYLKRDAEYLSPALGRAHHIVVMKGEGSYLWDDKDDKYLDLTSGIAVNQLGHAHPEVVQAISEQAAKCIHTSCVVHYPANIELAEKLASIMPGDINCTFFSNSGAEAVDGAIKFSKLLKPGRTNIIAFRGAFHGRSVGGTSLTSSKAGYRKFYDPLLAGIHFIEYPNTYKYDTEEERKHFEEHAIDELERLFATSTAPESVAAIFIEPQLGEGGYVPAPHKHKNYLQSLRDICDKHGILLVFDEVQSGMGRTGKWFTCDHYGVVPDILLMAKGLSGGMPLGAFAAKHELMQKMPPGSHGSTFGGNPVSCRAALKLIEVMERDNIIANVNDRSKQIYDFFESHFPGSNQNDCSKAQNQTLKVRGMGLMLALEFEDDQMVEAVKKYAFENKVLVLPCGTYGNIIRLAPNLNISEAEMQEGLDIILAGIKAAKGAVAA